jgi:hypothetical protein
MALNGSGPISLGGATTGQSINLELGQSATAQVSLNDANVRSLAGVPSGTIIVPADFWGKYLETPSILGNLYISGADNGPTAGGEISLEYYGSSGSSVICGLRFSSNGRLYMIYGSAASPTYTQIAAGSDWVFPPDGADYLPWEVFGAETSGPGPFNNDSVPDLTLEVDRDFYITVSGVAPGNSANKSSGGYFQLKKNGSVVLTRNYAIYLDNDRT